MKKTLFAFIILLTIGVSTETYAQYDYNWAAGFRIGEPLGFNLRKYFQNGERAFDINVGTYGFIYNKNRKYNGGEYRAAGLMIQGMYLWHLEVFSRDWAHVYYGAGLQINNRTHFFYSRNVTPPQEIRAKKISIGPSGTAGLELKLPKQPIAFFIDAGLYVEALPSPFFLNPQISTGLRLNIIK